MDNLLLLDTLWDYGVFRYSSTFNIRLLLEFCLYGDFDFYQNSILTLLLLQYDFWVLLYNTADVKESNTLAWW